ncbi:MAG: hypothetical protein NVS2B3_03940 [Vulcanimicrobiaceae bacterium]
MLDFAVHLRDHVALALAALGIAMLVGMPLGAFVACARRGSSLVLGVL